MKSDLQEPSDGPAIVKGNAAGKASAGKRANRKRRRGRKGRVVEENVGGVEKRAVTDVAGSVLRKVGDEVLHEDLDPTAWARALVEGKGTRDDTLSQYARIRVESLTKQEGDLKSRKVDLEKRLKSSFRTFHSVAGAKPQFVKERKVVDYMDAVFWHVIALVGGIGSVVAADVVWPTFQLSGSWTFVGLVVLGLQLIPFVGWRVGGRHRSLPGRSPTGVTYSQASQMVACFAMLVSLLVGCKLLMGHPPRYQEMSVAEVRAETPKTTAAFPQRVGYEEAGWQTVSEEFVTVTTEASD